MITFLNQNAIEDESITKSKLDAALKTEIENKQDTLTVGAGIDITDNKISCTLDTTIFKAVDSLPTAPASGDENKIHLVLSSSSEEENTYDEYIWVNNSWEKIGSFRPTIDLSRYAEKSYVDSQIEGEAIARTEADAALQTQINGKQEALTLTVKNNGNIVLANIQGQSKEFMPATPSGDPMHYAYVTAGAEYNDTGADIVKTAPWADMVDDDYTGEYGKTVVHKAGYWYLNGLGDLTTNEIRKIYTRGSVNFMEGNTLSDWRKDKNIYIRTNFNYNGGAQGAINGSRCAQGNVSLKVMLFCNQQSNNHEIVPVVRDIFPYIYCYHILGVFASAIEIKFWNAINLITLRFCPFYSVGFNESSNLSVKSVLYMINNGAKSNPITITLHKTVYDRCMANDAIKTALQNHTNVSLASA